MPRRLSLRTMRSPTDLRAGACAVACAVAEAREEGAVAREEGAVAREGATKVRYTMQAASTSSPPHPGTSQPAPRTRAGAGGRAAGDVAAGDVAQLLRN